MRVVLVTLFAGIFCLLPLSTIAAAPPPNIIFLFADDQRADTIGAHGNSHIRTPNLDRLAAEGFSFNCNYCAGSYSGAVCVASRAMLMTGRHWMRIDDRRGWANLPLLPELLAGDGGYQNFITGKWHNGARTLKRSFDAGQAVYMGGMCNHADFEVQDFRSGELSKKREAGGFSSEVFADAAIELLDSASSETPFFLYVAFTAPHDPRNPPPSYRRMYYENRPPLPPNFMPQHPFKNSSITNRGRDESLAPWPRPPGMIEDQIGEYYGLITHLDEQVGRILQTLDNGPHAENTYVIYTADHGLAMGSHGLLGKQNVYEQSMRSPLILRGPGIPAGGSSSSFTYILDLYATVCRLAGVDVPTDVDSRDLGPIWRGEKPRVRESLFLPFQSEQRAISDGRFKLHVYPKINHRLLFDLEKDPHETTNLADDAEYVEKMNRLMAMLDRWRDRLGDETPVQAENPEPKTIEYRNGDRRLDVWQPAWIRAKYFGGRSNTNHGRK